MSVWGWVAIGVVVLAIMLVAVVALGTVRRVKGLKSVLVMDDLNADVAALQARIAGMQDDIANVQQSVQMTQERMEYLKR
jgi:hypothetical protein